MIKAWPVLFILLLFFSGCERQEEQEHPAGTGRTAGHVLRRAIPEKPAQAASESRIAGTGAQTGVTVHPERKKSRKKSPTVIIRERSLPSDSLRQVRICALRAQHIEPDLSEPVTRSLILHPEENPSYLSMITLSRESFLKINFDNDILNNTDMYYTNGIRIDLISPLMQKVPFSGLMIPYWSRATNYYGLSVLQNMYTPSTTKTGGIHYGDRPYAAFLCLAMFKISNDAAHRFRQTSELDIGVIGPSSLGEFVQKSFHDNTPNNNEPLGWEYQIQDDLVLNYNVTFEKGILIRPRTEVNLTAAGALGTLYTNMEGGFYFRTGLVNPYFANLGLSKKAISEENGLRPIQVFFFLRSSARLVGYDATLEGGMLNHSSPYTISPKDISRVMLESSGGFSLVYRGFRFDAEQYLLSPEFHEGRWHLWVHAGLTFCL
jgi:lipid A 3-O-deacylase